VSLFCQRQQKFKLVDQGESLMRSVRPSCQANYHAAPETGT
jgi:hypothetical protein